MKFTPYRTLLTMTKEAIDKALIPVRINAARKQAELEMAKLDEKCATLESEINAACSTREINFEGVINKMDDLALAQRRKQQFREILEGLFPTPE